MTDDARQHKGGRPRLHLEPPKSVRRWVYANDPAEPALRVWALGLLTPEDDAAPDAPGLLPEVLHEEVCARLTQRSAPPGDWPFEHVADSDVPLLECVTTAIHDHPAELWTGGVWTALELVRRLTITWPVKPGAREALLARGFLDYAGAGERPPEAPWRRAWREAQEDSSPIAQLAVWVRHHFAPRWVAWCAALPFNLANTVEHHAFVDTFERIRAELMSVEERGQRRQPPVDLRTGLKDNTQRGNRRVVRLDHGSEEHVEPRWSRRGERTLVVIRHPGGYEHVALPKEWYVVGGRMRAFANVRTATEFAEALMAHRLSMNVTDVKLALARSRKEVALHRTWTSYGHWLRANRARLEELEGVLGLPITTA